APLLQLPPPLNLNPHEILHLFPPGSANAARTTGTAGVAKLWACTARRGAGNGKTAGRETGTGRGLGGVAKPVRAGFHCRGTVAGAGLQPDRGGASRGMRAAGPDRTAEGAGLLSETRHGTAG